jgi:rod shape-determining protein MreD
VRASAVLFLSLYLLHALVAEANDALSGMHVWIFAGGLYVVYAALMFPLREGIAATLLAGLACDAATPLPFGTHTFLFVFCHLVLFQLRERIQRHETVVRVVIALFLNAGMFIAIALVEALRGSGGHALKLMGDLGVSEAVVALAGPWFFALQAASLKLARASPGRFA